MVPTPRVTAVPTLPPYSGPKLPATATIKDKGGDLQDEDGKAVRKPAYIDVRSLKLAVDGANLVVTLVVGGSIPLEHSSLVSEINFTVVLVTDGASDFTHWVGILNLESGDWIPAFDDWVANRHYDGDEFPGDGVIEGSTLVLRVSLASLGNPATVRAAVTTQAVDHSTGFVEAEDQLPNGYNFRLNDKWVGIATQPG